MDVGGRLCAQPRCIRAGEAYRRDIRRREEKRRGEHRHATAARINKGGDHRIANVSKRDIILFRR